MCDSSNLFFFLICSALNIDYRMNTHTDRPVIKLGTCTLYATFLKDHLILIMSCASLIVFVIEAFVCFVNSDIFLFVYIALNYVS